jgi:hypothetical protein
MLTWRHLEALAVASIALHSFAVGLVLVFFPAWAASFGGWGDADPLFFIRQGGAFHLVVAAGYVVEYLRHRSVSLMLIAKSLAVVFLGISWAVDPGVWAVPLSAASDGLMAVAIWWIHQRASVAVTPG